MKYQRGIKYQPPSKIELAGLAQLYGDHDHTLRTFAVETTERRIKWTD